MEHTDPETKVYLLLLKCTVFIEYGKSSKKEKNPYFCIEFAGQEDQSHTVLDNLQQIRSKLTTRYIQPVGNLQVIEDLYIQTLV